MEPQQLEPNLKAQYKRHKGVFLKKFFFSRLLTKIKMSIRRLFKVKRRRFSMLAQQPIKVKDPLNKFLYHTIMVTIALFVVTSIIPTRILETGFTADYFGDDSDFLDSTNPSDNPPFIMNDEGYVLKSSPETQEASRVGMTDFVTHVIAEGDTVSAIASLYGINTSTLLWENNISESSTLRVGQSLVIPPVNGVSHLVASKETVESIAKDYGVDPKVVRDQNKLEGDVIVKGEKLFIPGGKQKYTSTGKIERLIARAGTRSGSRTENVNTFDKKVVIATDEQPDGDKPFIFPTIGKITQGFRPGHYADDIGNQSKPDIWAAAGGTVVLATGGCPPREVKVDRSCGGGYGNHVIIDHGNGLQTLYAHMETVYVSEGDSVVTGQAVGKMGNTGRTYGSTGIHVHFEVYVDGVRKNPMLFTKKD